METVSCKVNGMTCNNCALGISNYLRKCGVENITVSFATGDVRFDVDKDAPVQKILKGIHKLGYEVVLPGEDVSSRNFLQTLSGKLVFSLLFTVPLMLHMVIRWHWLQNSWVQLFLCLPVYVLGMYHFGKSAVRSLKSGTPNMDVLITMGATAAFVYSLIGTLLQLGHEYLFYETAAGIITLVLLGNLLEERSVRQTTTAISELARIQVTTARLILEGEREQIREIDNRELKTGDKVLVNAGDKIPMDGVLYWGSGGVNEAMVSGESELVKKNIGDKVIGGTILESGTLKMEVTATGKDTVLSYIIELVKQAQGNKPPMQKLADRISAVFVPVVAGIALLTFCISYFAFPVSFQDAMMRSIAVLVIACPCAMGLATPAAVMVGLGRAARKGILIKGGHTLEAFRNIRQVVFDKTGTLTTGKLVITGFDVKKMAEEDFKSIVYTLEKHAAHPIAKAVARQWRESNEWPFETIEEHKGMGMSGMDADGDHYELGSFRFYPGKVDKSHNLYLFKNGMLTGWMDLEDEVRPDAKQVIAWLKSRHIKTFLLSGDLETKCASLAARLGIDEVFAEQTPEQKLQTMEGLCNHFPTAMVGDGINDAPALAKADIGISLSDATQVAMQSANVVLLSNELRSLPLALGIGKHTYMTIRQNLFWAFFYNVIAIPVAALGFLSPIIGAAIMGLSDVVLAINSIRLRYKKVLD